MHMRANFSSHPLHVCTRPNQVDVAPLVPAEGLLLAEVRVSTDPLPLPLPLNLTLPLTLTLTLPLTLPLMLA